MAMSTIILMCCRSLILLNARDDSTLMMKAGHSGLAASFLYVYFVIAGMQI